MSVLEAGGPEARDVARAARARAGRAWVVGVTGAAGAGKSTLVGLLVGEARARDERVAVVAVDPSSPLSGGAVLADRVRFQQHATDPGVFVRSMATRGRLGGLAAATRSVVDLLDACGWPLVLVETAGAGQAEVDVAAAADSCVVVVTPGWGDALQVAKAGLMEVADVFVVNKADRPGVEQAVHDLEAAVQLGAGSRDGEWATPVVTTLAARGEGGGRLWEALDAHRGWLGAEGRRSARREARVAADLERMVADEAAGAAGRRCRGPAFDALVADVVAGRIDLHDAADRI